MSKNAPQRTPTSPPRRDPGAAHRPPLPSGRKIRTTCTMRPVLKKATSVVRGAYSGHSDRGARNPQGSSGSVSAFIGCPRKGLPFVRHPICHDTHQGIRMHAHTRRRRQWVNRISRIIPALHKLGIRTGRAQSLTTTGRRSGRPRTQPIGVVSLFGNRYIFQAYPRAAWVANARANPRAILADGRRRSRIILVEVDVEQRRHLLLAQLTNEPDIGNLLSAAAW